MKKIRTPTEFESFSDGFADLYRADGNKVGEFILRAGFGRQMTSYRRHFAARAAGTQIDLVIHIPVITGWEDIGNVVIDENRYKVEQRQLVESTNPRIIVLSLKRMGIYAQKNQT